MNVTAGCTFGSGPVGLVLPGVDQVLGQADAGVGAGDGDLSVGGSLHGVGDLDLSP